MRLVYRKGDSVKTARMVGGFYGALIGLLIASVLGSLGPGVVLCSLLCVPAGLIIGALVMGVDAAKLQQPAQTNEKTSGIHDK